MAVGPLAQDREILADSLPIYDAAGHLVHGLICSTRGRAPVDSPGRDFRVFVGIKRRSKSMKNPQQGKSESLDLIKRAYLA
jgi:hypothetical protein